MVAALYLRGPDDCGTSLHGATALGMRRLSIIDVDGGHQPIENEDGTVRVIQNGEIYSFPALREELARTHEFKTRSDTECLVHGYEEWGLEGLLERLNGMFAFAIQDDREGAVYLARDRLGIKPLLYGKFDDWLVFGSSPSALVASGLVPPEPDPLGLRLYLHNQFIPGPYSAIAGVEKLPPAHYVRITGGRVSEPIRYWSLPPESRQTQPPEQWAERLGPLLADAVRCHMVSDVEVGLFLSGGLDSSGILALMAKHGKGPVKAFSIGFEDAKVYDESPYARHAAERFGAELHHTVFTAEHVLELAAQLVTHIEEPLGDAACLPTFLLSREASRQVKVVLSGEGADELFAGYGYYRDVPPRDPNGRSAVVSLLRTLFRPGLAHGFRRSTEFGRRSPISGFPYAMSAAVADELLAALPLDGGAQRIAAEIERLERSWLAPRPSSPLTQALSVDAGGWLADDLLMKLDRTTMAHSLEARVPFLDYRIAELAFSMPADVKLRAGRGKAVLRDALGVHLGNDLAGRGKHGFDLPMHEWLRGPLRSLVTDTLHAGTAWISHTAGDELLDAHMAGRNLERPLWTLFVLSAWFQRLDEARTHAPAV